MDPTRLEDTEALCTLWDESARLAEDARRLAATATRLHHQVQRFSADYAEGKLPDPQALLRELGVTREMLAAVEACGPGIEEAAASLGFAFIPHPDPHPGIQEKGLRALRERLRSPRRGESPVLQAPGEGPLVQKTEP